MRLGPPPYCPGLSSARRALPKSGRADVRQTGATLASRQPDHAPMRSARHTNPPPSQRRAPRSVAARAVAAAAGGCTRRGPRRPAESSRESQRRHL
eukprot:scaffold23491_cov26-Tisochrysis_lutea.AAC.2